MASSRVALAAVAVLASLAASGCLQPSLEAEDDAGSADGIAKTRSSTGPGDATSSAAPASRSTAPAPEPSQSNSSSEGGTTTGPTPAPSDSPSSSTSTTSDTDAASTGSASESSTSTSEAPSGSSSTSSSPPAGPPSPQRIPAQAPSQRDWGSPAGKGLRPGIENGGCTSNFVFHLADQRYFLGSAAHCFNAGDDVFIPECGGWRSDPVGTRVPLHGWDGEEYEGTLAYSSWLAMAAADEEDAEVCAGNDFALVEVPASSWPELHPAVLHFGGPTGAPGSVGHMQAGQDVYAALSTDAYGGYVLEVETRPAHGTFRAYGSDGWHLSTDFGPGGISQGDSGGGLMGPAGEALGVASTGLQTGDAYFANLWFALAYMQDHHAWAPSLVTWASFDPDGRE